MHVHGFSTGADPAIDVSRLYVSTNIRPVSFTNGAGYRNPKVDELFMPTARWLQLAFAISLLFGAQAVFHRFRLWRIDAQRVRLEGEVSRLFEPGITVAEIAAMAPDDRHRDPVMVGDGKPFPAL